MGVKYAYDTRIVPKRNIASEHYFQGLCHHLLQKQVKLDGQRVLVPILDWPALNPDLNPIENLWTRLKKLVAMKTASSRRELIEAIVDAWFHVITPEHLEQLVDYWCDRCEAVNNLYNQKDFQLSINFVAINDTLCIMISLRYHSKLSKLVLK